MAKGIGEDGIKPDSELFELLYDNAGAAYMSALGKQEWMSSLVTTAKEAFSYLMIGRSVKA
jgi:hypothetical protein